MHPLCTVNSFKVVHMQVRTSGAQACMSSAHPCKHGFWFQSYFCSGVGDPVALVRAAGEMTSLGKRSVFAKAKLHLAAFAACLSRALLLLSICFNLRGKEKKKKKAWLILCLRAVHIMVLSEGRTWVEQRWESWHCTEFPQPFMKSVFSYLKVLVPDDFSAAPVQHACAELVLVDGLGVWWS